MKDSSLPRSAGFTMFELVIVMAIVAILAFIALPSYKYVTAANRISTEVNGLLSDMRYARTEAIKEGSTVTICVSTDQATCAAGNVAWASGWIIFSDPNNNQTVPGGTMPLRVQVPFSTAYSSTDTFNADNAFTAVTFNREGFGATHIATAANTVTITLHSAPANSQWTRCIAVTPIGGVYIEQAGVVNCL